MAFRNTCMNEEASMYTSSYNQICTRTSMWHMDPLLGNDSGIGKYTTAVTV
jgi:hypothetical protein